MISIITGGIVSAMAVLFMAFKFGNIRRVLHFDIIIDIVSTLALTFMLAGTFVGMMTAIFGGAIISIVLFLLKKIIGHDKLTITGWKPANRPDWITHVIPIRNHN
jgi:fatty acid desaturase